MKIAIGILVAVIALFLVGIFSAIGDTIFFPLLDKLGGLLGKKYGLKTSVTTEPNPLKNFVGSSATAITDLTPAGKIQIMETRHDASSTKGFLRKGQTVKVVKVDGNTLYVE